MALLGAAVVVSGFLKSALRICINIRAVMIPVAAWKGL
jgi:hypothetical protein